MKLSDYMAARETVSATGERVGRQMVLAMDCTESGAEASVANYTVCAYHIENHGATLTAGTTDRSYIGEGETTLKTSTKRAFNVTGQRLVGEPWQDFVCSHAIKYGTGSTVQRKYVYFDAGTMEGEQGTVTIAVAKDGTGAAGDPTDVDITLYVVGTPEEFTWTAPAPDPEGP